MNKVELIKGLKNTLDKFNHKPILSLSQNINLKNLYETIYNHLKKNNINLELDGLCNLKLGLENYIIIAGNTPLNNLNLSLEQFEDESLILYDPNISFAFVIKLS